MDIIMFLFVFLPIFASAIILAPIMPDNERTIRNIAKGSSYIILALAVILAVFFDFSQFDYCLEASYQWMNTVGINVSFMADSLAVIFCVVSSLIFTVVIHISKGSKPPFNLYYALLMALQTSVNGMILSKDIFLYFTFAALGLIPVFILLCKWGSSNREKTSVKYLLYRLIGLAFILTGFLLLYSVNFKFCGILSSDLSDINISSMPDNIKNIALICLLTGFFINMGLVPIHKWFLDTLTNAPSCFCIIMLSSLNIAFSFGFIRYVYLLFGNEIPDVSFIVCIVASATIIYLLLCAIREKNLKRIISYYMVTGNGLLLLGLFSFNITGITGGIMSLLLYSFLSAGLFITEKHIADTCGTDNTEKLGGLFHKMPKLSVTAFFFFLIFPSIFCFITILLTVNGVLFADNTDGLTLKLLFLLSAVSLLLYTAKLTDAYFRIFTGENVLKRKISDIKTKHIAILLLLALIIIFISMFMFVFADIIEMYIYNFLNQAELLNGIN